ncbi:MAG TPA: type 1 glutamine amidotransferase [Actinobacteria bacterium]|nr:type 1 glutamine amidotransferase [Actinomycetota bacterium]
MSSVALLVEDLYEDLELWYPYHRLREAGVDVVLVGPVAGKAYASKHGYPATADAGVDEVGAAEFDGVVIPGGYAPDRMRRHEGMVRLVADLDAAGKLVGAICHAGWMLVSAKILEGRRVTSFFAIRDDLVNAGAEWIDAPVVVDGNLVTSRTPADLSAFGAALVETLGR